ncbi:hypothetical protein N9812_03680 [bacterium]|nr:hypothetical protein [bacterium]
MFHLGGSRWGPMALPDFLRDQLKAHGFAPDDAGRCARLIGEQPAGAAAASSLFVDLGSCKFLEADIDGAIAAWRHAITSDHEAAAARSLLNLGLLYEHVHLYSRALDLLARVADRDVGPYVTPAAMASARCLVAMGDGDLAMESMARLAQRVMATEPEGVELSESLYALGDIAERMARPDRAERAWRAAMASGSADIQQAALQRRIQLLLCHGHDYAVVDLISTVAFESNAAGRVLLDVAETFLQRDMPGLAAAVLDRVEGTYCEPNDRFRLADAKIGCGQVNDAIDELEALLADHDEHVQVRALFSLGQVYAGHDMVDPAMSMFQRVVEADDDYWSPVGALAWGDLMASTGDFEAATEHWVVAADGAVSPITDQALTRLTSQSEPVIAQDRPPWSGGTSAMTVHPQPEHADTQRVLHNARGGVHAPKGEPVVVVLETLEPAAEHVSTDADRGDTLATASDETSAEPATKTPKRPSAFSRYT